MTDPFQSPSDRVLWILVNNGNKMERSRLRERTGMRYALLNPILHELVREGRNQQAVGFSLPNGSITMDLLKLVGSLTRGRASGNSERAT